MNWTIFWTDLDATAHTETSGVSGANYIYRVQAIKFNGKGGIVNRNKPHGNLKRPKWVGNRQTTWSSRSANQQAK